MTGSRQKLMAICLIGLSPVCADSAMPCAKDGARPGPDRPKAEVTRHRMGHDSARQLATAVDLGDSYQTPMGARRLLRLAGNYAICATPPSEAESLIHHMTRAESLMSGYSAKQEGEGWVVFTAPPAEHERQLKDPRRLAGILVAVRGERPEVVNPVFVDPNSGLRLMVNQAIIVRLRKDVAPKLYFGSEWTRVTPIPGTADQFCLALHGLTAEAIMADVNRRMADSRVLWAEPEFLVDLVPHFTPNDTYYPKQWHLNNTGQGGGTSDADVDAPEAWNTTRGTNTVVIAILDTGIQRNHPDLSNNIYKNAGDVVDGVDNDQNGYTDDYTGWDFGAGDNNPDPDPNSEIGYHGTACAGVAAAVGNNSAGVAGIAHGCRLLPVKVSSGDQLANNTRLANALRYAAGLTSPQPWRGADVISISFEFPNTLAFDAAVDDVTTGGRVGKGCPIFASIGNHATSFCNYTLTGIWAGTHTYRWQYIKDGSVSSGSDTVWLDGVSLPNGTRQSFEAGGLPSGWTTGGNAGWYNVQDGVDGNHALTGWNGPGSRALRAGAILDNQSSYVQVSLYNGGEGVVSFYTWTSCQGNSNYTNDRMEFLFDGEVYFQDDVEDAIITDPHYPASHSNVIAVGACTDFGFRADYSQYGSKLEFVAPSSWGASDIYTTDLTGTNGADEGSYNPYFGGTSASAPLAAGIAALMFSKNSALSNIQLRAILRKSCDKIGGVVYSGGEDGAGGWNNEYGYGRLNAFLAVSNTFLNDFHTLAVASPWGGAVPAGTNTYYHGTAVSAVVTNSPVVIGTTQYVCAGWTGTGSAPLTGTSTNTGLFTITNNSTLTWRWRTNFWLHIDKTGSGLVSTNDAWFILGTNIQVVATAATYYTFGHWEGQTNGCTMVSNRITVLMNAARLIVAVFPADCVTNGVPKWWLAQYGLTNFSADALGDVDHDGMLTWQEWVAGCIPVDSNSVFRLMDFENAAAEGVIVRWPSLSNRFYTLWGAVDLLAGTNAFTILPGASNMPATPAVNCFTDEVQGVGRRFYKVDVSE